MEAQLTPQQSFDLINKIIDDRRKDYEENGSIIFLWGIAIMIAGIGQFALMHTPLAERSGLIWFIVIMPMFLYTLYVSFPQRDNMDTPIIANRQVDVSGMAWFMAGVMAMLNGFVFGAKFGIAFTTALYLPFCVAALVSALTIRNKSFVWFVLIATVVAYSALYIPWHYHPLVSALVAFLMFFMPGLMLRNDHKKRINV